MEIHGGGIREVNIRTGILKSQLRLGAGVLAGLVLVSLFAHAQTMSFGKGSNVTYRDYYDPPNQSKVRAIVRGAEAIPEGKGRVRLKNLHIESFRENGELEAVVDAPDCVYDHALRTASSDGPLKARSADEQLQMQGVGFLLSLTNQSLYISNNFQISMHHLKLAPKKQ
jgi:hypothetical protein